MPALRIDEIVRTTGGKLERGQGDRVVGSFSIDTREMRPGGLFFALEGTRTDGHAYLGEAQRVGAAAAIISKDLQPDQRAPDALIRVASVEDALTRCGEAARERCRARFVAVTGSTGKTTTKELIAAGLGATRRVHRTERSLNNHLGVPLTLLACPEDAEFAVMELGMSAPGEIAALARLVRPEIGLVTNVCPAHLEFFESIDDIAAVRGSVRRRDLGGQHRRSSRARAGHASRRPPRDLRQTTVVRSGTGVDHRSVHSRRRTRL